MGRRQINFKILAIEARKYIRGQGFWWVHWAPPYNQRDRNDHWQPIESFIHIDSQGNEVKNDLFEKFELKYPGQFNVDDRVLTFENYPELDEEFFGLNSDSEGQ